MLGHILGIVADNAGQVVKGARAEQLEAQRRQGRGIILPHQPLGLGLADRLLEQRVQHPVELLLFHQRAGSRKVIELHGNITRTKSFDEETVVSNWPDTGEVPPKCPNCGGRLRPDVVWFEEALPEKEMELARQASVTCEVFLSIGTSTVVYPAAALPTEALRSGAVVVEINPLPTPLTALVTLGAAAASSG